MYVFFSYESVKSSVWITPCGPMSEFLTKNRGPCGVACISSCSVGGRGGTSISVQELLE